VDFHVVDLMVAAVPAKKKTTKKQPPKPKCPPCTKRCATRKTNVMTECRTRSCDPQPCNNASTSSDTMQREVRDELRRMLRERAQLVH